MTDRPDAVPSQRASERAAASASRSRKAALRQAMVEAMAAGWSIERIARLRKVNARTVRREIGRALDERRLDAADRYAHAQVARLTKALRAGGAAIDAGELKAVAPFLETVAALDRYHGLARLRRREASAQPALAEANPKTPGLVAGFGA